MLPTLRALVAQAKALEVEIEIECPRAHFDKWGNWLDYLLTAEAPGKLVFCSTGLHRLVVSGHGFDPKANKASALACALRDLQDGLEECSNEECEDCT
jgi:hypothetical protein